MKIKMLIASSLLLLSMNECAMADPVCESGTWCVIINNNTTGNVNVTAGGPAGVTPTTAVISGGKTDDSLSFSPAMVFSSLKISFTGKGKQKGNSYSLSSGCLNAINTIFASSSTSNGGSVYLTFNDNTLSVQTAKNGTNIAGCP